MEFIRGVHNIGPQHRGCVLAIGNFDGVHLGHQAVFRETVNHARRLGVAATALIFEPQPAEFFSAAPKPRTGMGTSTCKTKQLILPETLGDLSQNGYGHLKHR